MGNKSRSGSGMNIPDHISESLETILWVQILKFFDADTDPGSGNIFYPGSGIREGKISDPQHCQRGSFAVGQRTRVLTCCVVLRPPRRLREGSQSVGWTSTYPPVRPVVTYLQKEYWTLSRLCRILKKFCKEVKKLLFTTKKVLKYRAELVFVNVYGAQESIPRNQFRQPLFVPLRAGIDK
jgi:hypothetical protein